MFEKKKKKSVRSKKQIFLFSLIVCVAVLIILQWIGFNTEEGRLLMEQIHRGEVLIPGWEPTRDFRIATYIRPSNDTTILTGSRVCPTENPPNVLVVVASQLQNVELRLAIRKTWGLYAMEEHNISVAFIVGLSDSVAINAQIRKENSIYEDFIIEDFLDTPTNATIKSTMMLKWVIKHCPDTKFLMKTEDDVFVNIANLDKFVHNPTRVRPRLLVGKLMTGERLMVNRDSMLERYMPKYMYPHEEYPEHLSGVGYLMSIDTVPLLYQNALMSSFIYLEDVFITGICAEGATKITVYYDFRFYFIEGLNYRLHCEILYQQSLIIHSHNLSPMEMCDDYDELQRCLELTKDEEN